VEDQGGETSFKGFRVFLLPNSLVQFHELKNKPILLAAGTFRLLIPYIDF